MVGNGNGSDQDGEKAMALEGGDDLGKVEGGAQSINQSINPSQESASLSRQ